MTKYILRCHLKLGTTLIYTSNEDKIMFITNMMNIVNEICFFKKLNAGAEGETKLPNEKQVILIEA